MHATMYLKARHVWRVQITKGERGHYFFLLLLIQILVITTLNQNKHLSNFLARNNIKVEISICSGSQLFLQEACMFVWIYVCILSKRRLKKICERLHELRAPNFIHTDTWNEHLPPVSSYLELLLIWVVENTRPVTDCRYVRTCSCCLLTGFPQQGVVTVLAHCVLTSEKRIQMAHLKTTPYLAPAPNTSRLAMHFFHSKFPLWPCQKCSEANSEWIWPPVSPGCHYEIPASPHAIFNSVLSQWDHSHSQQAMPYVCVCIRLCDPEV